MEILLLLGLAALAVLVNGLHQRVKALEAEVDSLRSGERPEPLQDPAFVRPPRAVSAAAPQRPSLPFPEGVTADPAPPPAEPESEAEPATLGGAFERLVGGRLLIWIGGAALAVAGIFLVRHSIEIGLITPPVRMIMAGIFGALLVGAGEYARSRPGAAPDPRVAQALVGAGLLVLYATPYGAHILYGLIGDRTAFALMAAVTAAALVLSPRHGAAAAAMGLLGGFATPLLVGKPSPTSVPLLSYLALLDLALFVLARRRGWTWLAAAAVALSFGWTAVLVVSAAPQALPAGPFIVVLAVAASFVRAGGDRHVEFLRPALIGLAELAVLVARDDLGPAPWGLFALLSAATFLVAGRAREYRNLPAAALAVALLLLFLQGIDPGDPLLPWIAAGITALFATGGIATLLTGRRSYASAVVAATAFAAPAPMVRVLDSGLLSRPAWGLLLLLLAAGPILVAWLRRHAVAPERTDRAFAFASAAALLLLCAAASDLVPRALLGSAWLLIAVAVALAARRLPDRGLVHLAYIVAAAAVAWSAAIVPSLWETVAASIAGQPALATRLPLPGEALQTLLLPVPLLLAAWRLLPGGPWLKPAPLAAACLFAAATAYILFKQLFGLASHADFVALGLAERTALNQALFLAGWAMCAGRLPIPGLDKELRWWVGISLTAFAAARLVWFDLMIHNPALVAQEVGALPVLNLILPAYLLGAFWLYKARRSAGNEARSGIWLLLFLAALVGGVMLMVRQLLHGSILAAQTVLETESYGYSLAGLLLSIALMLAGMRLPDKALRLAGLVLLTATIAKVFGWDARVLQGLLRILSFLGLGIGVIGIGKLYGAVLSAEARPARAERS